MVGEVGCERGGICCSGGARFDSGPGVAGSGGASDGVLDGAPDGVTDGVSYGASDGAVDCNGRVGGDGGGKRSTAGKDIFIGVDEWREIKNALGDNVTDGDESIERDVERFSSAVFSNVQSDSFSEEHFGSSSALLAPLLP